MRGVRVARVVAGTLAIGLGAWAVVATRAELATPVDLRDVDFVGSAECRRCHEDHYASWHRTFHRTMTQEASEASVLGDFDDATLAYLGWTFRFARDERGPHIDAEGPRGERRTWLVDRTVGSHRYQQYLARDGDSWWRLPVAWHVGEARWFPMNGAFLTPDPPAPATREDMERHVTRWNDNCVFCHNVAPNPGRRANGAFETEVAELGVACEACHGPGAEHVARNTSPLRRYWLHYVADDDPTLVNLHALTAERASDVCGRCHGQRKTSNVDAILAQGDPFVPGEDLAQHSEPLWIDTTLGDEEGLFEARFWADGTPRLTAYEYQGWLQSSCGRDPTFGCTSCHAMHEGDPAGQLHPSAEGDGACTSCHASHATEDHDRHEDELGVRCVDCHMPRIVYGVLDAHRSHRVASPDPGRDAQLGRPDACTACHADRSATWAARATARLWPSDDAHVDADGDAASDATTEADGTPALFHLLFGGDPIARTLAADALGRAPLVSRPRARAALLDTMRHDPYPAVRRLAFRSFRRLVDDPPPWSAFDPTESALDRVARCDALAATTVTTSLDPEHVARLRERAAQDPLWIGE